MGKLVFIMGRSGTGKSHSMKNVPADDLGIINIEGKDLPFGKTSPAFKAEKVHTDNPDKILRTMQDMAKRHKIIVIDDFQYLMANEFMRRVYEKGYDKWNEIAKHAFDVLSAIPSLPDETIVYVFCHTDRDDDGNEKVKTLGRLLDDKIVLEGMSTIVLKAECVDGQYYFYTQNNGKDTVKSPDGMFPSMAIPNDLKYVDDKIRNYWDMSGAVSDEEIAKQDESHTVAEEPKKRRRRSRDAEEPKQTEAAAEEPKSEPAQPTAADDGWFFMGDENNVKKIHAGEEIPAAAYAISEKAFNACVAALAKDKDADLKEIIKNTVDLVPFDDVPDSEFMGTPVTERKSRRRRK